MSFEINPHNIGRATIYTMLLAASFHLLASLFKALLTGNPDYANMFNIIGISLFFPELGTGSLNCLLGILFVIGVGTIGYFVMQHHDRVQRKGS